MSMELISDVVAVNELSPKTQIEMFELFRACFKSVDWQVFCQDLRAKHWVILMRDRQGILRGFSTLEIYQVIHLGEPVTIVYSGDTIVAPVAWGSFEPLRTFLQTAFEKVDGSNRAFWFLISSGFRTYRILPVLFGNFYPSFQFATPAAEQELIDIIAFDKFGNGYDARAGLVHLTSPQPLCDELAKVDPDRIQDQHIRFFLEHNPNHADGDELVCLTELKRSNLTAAGTRLLDRARRRALVKC